MSDSKYDRKAVEQVEIVFKLLKKIKPDPESELELEWEVAQTKKELAFALATAYGRCQLDAKVAEEKKQKDGSESSDKLEQVLQLSKLTARRDALLNLMQLGRGSHHSKVDKEFNAVCVQIERSNPPTEFKANASTDNSTTPLLVSESNSRPVEEKKQPPLTELKANASKLAPNEFKADFYLAAALGLEEPENVTESLFTFFSWFTTTRLGWLRGEREGKIMVEAISSTHLQPKGILGNDFSVGQFSYLPEMMVSFYELIHESIRPETADDKEKNLYWYQRFEWERCRQTFWGNVGTISFSSFFSNAVVWLLVNGPAFLIGIPIVTAILNLLGFAFDIWHDLWFAHKEVTELREIEAQLDNNNSLFNELGFSNKLKTRLRTQLDNDIKTAKNKRKRMTIVAVGIFIGMAILYLPVFFTAWPLWLMISAKLLGSTIVIGAGFLYGGICGRLYRYSKTSSWNKNTKLTALATSLASITSVVVASFSATSLIPPLWLFVIMCALPFVLIAIKEGIRKLERREDFSQLGVKSDITKYQPVREWLDQLDQLDRSSSSLSIGDGPIDITLFQTKINSNQMSALKHVAGFTDRELTRHLRCWSQESTQRESLLRYSSFNEFRSKLREKIGSTTIPTAMPNVLMNNQSPNFSAVRSTTMTTATLSSMLESHVISNRVESEVISGTPSNLQDSRFFTPASSPLSEHRLPFNNSETTSTSTTSLGEDALGHMYMPWMKPLSDPASLSEGSEHRAAERPSDRSSDAKNNNASNHPISRSFSFSFSPSSPITSTRRCENLNLKRSRSDNDLMRTTLSTESLSLESIERLLSNNMESEGSNTIISSSHGKKLQANTANARL